MSCRIARTASRRAVPASLVRVLALGLMLIALAAAVCLRPVTATADTGEAAPAPAATAAAASTAGAQHVTGQYLTAKDLPGQYLTGKDKAAAWDQTSAEDLGAGGGHCAKKQSTEAPNAPQAAHDTAPAPVITLPRPAHTPTPREGGHYTGPAPPAPSPVSLSVLRI